MKNKIRTVIWLGLVLVLATAVSGWAQVRHDSVLFVADVSMSMSQDKYVRLEKKLIQDMNARFPSYVKSAGLLTFGHRKEPRMEPQMNWWFPVGTWDRASFGAAAGKIVKATGHSPIGDSLDEAAEQLTKSEGITALILISDGRGNGWTNSVKKAQHIKNDFGDKVCIFTIVYGTDTKGTQLMADIAWAGGCGIGLFGSDLTSSQQVQSLVDYIFPPVSVPPAKVVELAPPVRKLQPKLVLIELSDAHFDFDSSKITPAGITILDKNIRILKANPNLNILIAGYASASGTEEYNQKLSERRATAVRDYLINNGGIAPERLQQIGYGESRRATYEPYPDDLESEAAKSNMRVLFTIIVKEAKQ